MTLEPGQWFMYPIDSGIPKKVKVYSGSVHRSTLVATISKNQALALRRWHSDPCIYYSYKGSNDRWIDVRVVGDIEAWHGEHMSTG